MVWLSGTVLGAQIYTSLLLCHILSLFSLFVLDQCSLKLFQNKEVLSISLNDLFPGYLTEVVLAQGLLHFGALHGLCMLHVCLLLLLVFTLNQLFCSNFCFCADFQFQTAYAHKEGRS